ncbi:hypothetical protein [Wukongibacter sp. M2B1]|uniref:hypothetical protein n=1 Tax=Wukongibacter sp. M2B1 TaxID=3088895 RepID=UPI003D792DC8
MTTSFTTILNTDKDLESLFGKAKDKLLNNSKEASAKFILEFIAKETIRYLKNIFLPDKSNFIQFCTEFP